MKLEDITVPPPRLSPEMRYASLHRTIESGLATDKIWSELIDSCIDLGRCEEAEKCLWEIKDGATRRRLLVYLQRRGLLKGIALGDAEDGVKADPVASDRPRGASGEDSFVERIVDAFRFLFSDHMPVTTVVTTVTFPIVVGVGGFLTSTVHSTLLLPLLALIPALSVVGLVGALGRRILVEASQGLDDPPDIPAARPLAREAGRFLLDFGILTAIFLGPGAILTQLIGFVGWSGVAAAFGVGMLLLPMAMALRQTRDEWSCLKPSILFRAVQRGGVEYLAVVAVATVLFVPSFLSVWLTGGSHLYLVISVVGPLAVTPTFVVSRMLGQFLFSKRRVLPVSIPSKPQAAPEARQPRARPAVAAPRPAGPLQSASHPGAPQVRQPARGQTASRAARAPVARAAGPGSAPRPAARPAAARRPVAAPGSAPSVRRPLAARPAPAEPSPAPRSISDRAGAPAPRLRIRDDLSDTPPPPFPKTPRRAAPTTMSDEAPDLTKMPGFSVLKGDARVAAGAAAPTRSE